MFDKIEYAIKVGLKEGAQQVEAYLNRSQSKSVSAEKGELKMAVSKRIQGLGIRVLYEGGIGFAYTIDLSEKAIEETVKKAIKVAKARGKDPYYKTFPGKTTFPKVSGVYFKETVETSLDTLVETVSHMVEVARDYDRRITSVSASFGVRYGEKFIGNSLGIESSEKYSSASLSVFAVIEEASEMTSGYEVQAERNIKKLNSEEVAQKAAKMAVDLLHPKKIETAKVDVLLKPIALMSLLGPTLVNAVRADNVQEKRSFLVGKLGKQIAVEELTIVDDPLKEEGLGSRSFDDEGVASKKITIVENGILKSYLHNSYTAQREGVENTGHAARGYSSEPSISPSNFIILVKEEKDYEKMIEEVKKGVVANSVIGAHTANPITGEFSVALGECFYIENGVIKYPVKQAMIGGNILDLLTKITAIGRDRRQLGSIETGTLYFKEVTVSG